MLLLLSLSSNRSNLTLKQTKMDTENGNRSLQEDLKWASMRGFLSLDKLYVRKISKQDCWTMVRKVRLAWKDVSVIAKKCSKHIEKIVGWKRTAMEKRKPTGSCRLRSERKDPASENPGTLPSLLQQNPVHRMRLERSVNSKSTSHEFCRNMTWVKNNWNNCTKGAALPNATAWTSAPISSPNPLPLCCNWGIPPSSIRGQPLRESWT